MKNEHTCPRHDPLDTAYVEREFEVADWRMLMEQTIELAVRAGPGFAHVYEAKLRKLLDRVSDVEVPHE